MTLVTVLRPMVSGTDTSVIVAAPIHPADQGDTATLAAANSYFYFWRFI